MTKLRKWIPYIILLAAFAVRGWQLTAVPPGLTHDEADHGHDAAYILKGVRLIYFTVGYGREPLFDYLNAGFIAGMGARPITLRFSAIVISLMTLAATYRLGKVTLGRTSGVLAMALMAAAYWPLTTSRQILRSDLLPAEMALAAICFLKVLGVRDARRRRLWALGLALALGASFYTYIPARLLWIMFPVALVFGGLYAGWPLVRRAGPAVLAAIGLGALLAAPLAVYLFQNPEAEQRIGMLSEPLTALRSGDASLLLNNAKEFGLALFWPGHGDSFLAYNIPGQPVYDWVTAALAVIGVVILIRWLVVRRRADTGIAAAVAAPLMLAWLAIGLAPSFVTGPEALTTRIIGAQPVMYLIPALGLSQLLARLPRLEVKTQGGRKSRAEPPAPLLTSAGQAIQYMVVPAFLVILMGVTVYNYFVTWGESPDVRGAYKSTLVAMLTNLTEPSLISSQNPNAPHDPYIGELLTTADTRWADVRYAVVLRPNDSQPMQLLAPSSTPLHPFFQAFFQQRIKVPLATTDVDPFYIVFQPRSFSETTPSQASPQLNGALELRTVHWLAGSYKPGDTAELLTGWKVIDATHLGPVQAPTFRTNLVLFTHVLRPDGTVLAQQDRLDAPSWDWQTGDTILQIQQFAIPNDTGAGEYTAEVGFYDRATGDRLAVSAPETLAGSDATTLAAPPLVIQP